MDSRELRLGMATRRRRRAGSARTTQFVVLCASVVVGATGVWLWWLGESQDLIGASNSGSLLDALTLQLWMRRLHLAATVVLALAILALAVQAAAATERWRTAFLLVFLGLIGLGVFSGFQSEWAVARLWASTRGSRFGAFVTFDSGASVPDELRLVRAHMAIIPASLAIVALLAALRDRFR